MAPRRIAARPKRHAILNPRGFADMRFGNIASAIHHANGNNQYQIPPAIRNEPAKFPAPLKIGSPASNIAMVTNAVMAEISATLPEFVVDWRL
ncbi:MAG: hypothetical protein U1E92_06705 [Moraxella osloensis]